MRENSFPVHHLRLAFIPIRRHRGDCINFNRNEFSLPFCRRRRRRLCYEISSFIIMWSWTRGTWLSRTTSTNVFQFSLNLFAFLAVFSLVQFFYVWRRLRLKSCLPASLRQITVLIFRADCRHAQALHNFYQWFCFSFDVRANEKLSVYGK